MRALWLCYAPRRRLWDCDEGIRDANMGMLRIHNLVLVRNVTCTGLDQRAGAACAFTIVSLVATLYTQASRTRL